LQGGSNGSRGGAEPPSPLTLTTGFAFGNLNDYSIGGAAGTLDGPVR